MERTVNYSQTLESCLKRPNALFRECETASPYLAQKKIKGSNEEVTYHGDLSLSQHKCVDIPSANLLILPTKNYVSEVVSDGRNDKRKGEGMKPQPIIKRNSNQVAHVHASNPAKGRKLNYEELEDRMKTFKLPPQWEGPVDYQSMTEAGFVYTGQEDLVFCFSCNIKLDRWSKDMEPLLRHKEESPTCSFMRQKLQAVKGERGKTKSVAIPSKPLNSHTVVTGLNEPRLSYGGSFDDRPGASLPITPENYQSEEERIKSFVGWPLNEAVHPEQLARVGFVYTGDGALVQCFQCGVKYRHWCKGDVPLSVHQKCNPRCLFLQTLVSKSKSSPSEQRPTRSYIQPESLPVGSNTENEEVSKHSLQFPDYSDQAIRLQSFKHWGGVLPAHELAEAGFYMIARRDIVRCHSCNVVVQEWEKSDNVIDEHHRLSPDCSFLKMLTKAKSGSQPVIKRTDNRTLQLHEFGSPGAQLSPPSRSPSKSTDNFNEEKISLDTLQQPVQSSNGSDNSNNAFRSPTVSQNGSPTNTKSQEALECEGSCQVMESVNPHLNSAHDRVEETAQRMSNNRLLEDRILHHESSLGQDHPSSSSWASADYPSEIFYQSQSTEQRSSYVRLQQSSLPPDLLTETARSSHPPSLGLSSLPSGMKTPPSMNSRSWHRSPDNGAEGAVHYSPRLAQRRLSFPQGASCLNQSNKMAMYEENLPGGLATVASNISTNTNDATHDTSVTRVGLCQICYEKKIDCIFLPCGHARTCVGCATRIKNSGQPCPYCRKGISTIHRIYL